MLQFRFFFFVLVNLLLKTIQSSALNKSKIVLILRNDVTY
jgi:hypothetical protein